MPVSTPTFAEAFCLKHGLDSMVFERAVLRRTLYPHARFLRPFFGFFCRDYFVADIDFIRGVALLRRVRDFKSEMEEFAHHPANRGFWRRRMRVRVSSTRLKRLVCETLHPDGYGSETFNVDDATIPPFVRKQEDEDDRARAVQAVRPA